MSIKHIYISIFILLIISFLLFLGISNMRKQDNIVKEENSIILENNINESLINNVSEIVIETNDGKESFVFLNNPKYNIQIKADHNNKNIIILTKRD